MNYFAYSQIYVSDTNADILRITSWRENIATINLIRSFYTDIVISL